MRDIRQRISVCGCTWLTEWLLIILISNFWRRMTPCAWGVAHLPASQGRVWGRVPFKVCWWWSSTPQRPVKVGLPRVTNMDMDSREGGWVPLLASSSSNCLIQGWPPLHVSRCSSLPVSHVLPEDWGWCSSPHPQIVFAGHKFKQYVHHYQQSSGRSRAPECFPFCFFLLFKKLAKCGGLGKEGKSVPSYLKVLSFLCGWMSLWLLELQERGLEQPLKKVLRVGSFQSRNLLFIRSTNTWKYIFIMIGSLGLVWTVIIISHMLFVTSPFVLIFSFLFLATLLPSLCFSRD